MRGNRNRKIKSVVARTPDKLGEVLGLSKGDIALMKYKAELSDIATRAIRESDLSVNEIVKHSGTQVLRAPRFLPLKMVRPFRCLAIF